jgi:hypothetical protein
MQHLYSITCNGGTIEAKSHQESVSHCQVAESAKGTPRHKEVARRSGTWGHNIIFLTDPRASLPNYFRQGECVCVCVCSESKCYPSHASRDVAQRKNPRV